MARFYASNIGSEPVMSPQQRMAVTYDNTATSPASAPTADDDIAVLIVPAGVRVTRVVVIPEDHDSGTTVTCSVGFSNVDGSTDAADDYRLVADAASILQSTTATTYYPQRAAPTVPYTTDKNKYLVVRYTGTFAGWQASKKIRAIVEGVGVGT